MKICKERKEKEMNENKKPKRNKAPQTSCHHSQLRFDSVGSSLQKKKKKWMQSLQATCKVYIRNLGNIFSG